MKVPQFSPWVGQTEIKAISQSIKDNWITEGPKSQLFVQKLLKLIGSHYGVLAPNGTLALYLALKAIGIKKGDHVLVPDFTFIASATSVEMLGAKPIFVDVNKDNFQIDLTHAAKRLTKKTTAIMPVHIYGTIANMTQVVNFSKKHNLMIIEDAAQAIGVHWQGKHAGTFGDIGCFSFFADKTITTAEGGFIVTNSKKIYQKLLYLRNQGRIDRGSFIHPQIGYNFRLTDIQSSIGLAQLDKLKQIKQRKLHLLKLYQTLLKDLKDITMFKPEPGVDWIPFRVGILHPQAKKLMAYMSKQGIESRTFFYPLHKQPCFAYLKNNSKNFPNSIYGYEHGICLPTFPTLTDQQVKYVCQVIKQFVRTI